MDLKKIFSTASLALIIDFVTEWTKLLHTDYFVHPDWQKTVDADARLFSVFAADIPLYCYSQLDAKGFATNLSSLGRDIYFIVGNMYLHS